ncbi:ABC transporter permease [Nocardia asteroides]|uniref:ABC transporter permease protein n=1 Tax=Nocardia asteroides NBRC 15531 TaxID=1110697 RepID=U5EHU1_NOCAS|nr:ABC transporter permease [Nocardia asteroides]UGT51212.1 ABC transporter permease [Nocardia asteroides]GAD85928.1 putative ABC transporter permease protein [Nocardia asteroides NBRC 15531]SFM32095.1 NitT/TauT family transport system permease protein/sulfonate transport system permease protein [Nocardia asteroides]VEG35905.1 Putative aliphatic sulfonates transport permease protein ssuC [Nocardia asteroides]
MTSTVRTTDPPASTVARRRQPVARRLQSWITRASPVGWTIAGLTLAALAWTLLVASNRFPDELLPSVSEIIGAADDLRRTGLLADDILASLRRALGGFALGALTGVGAAIVTASTMLGRRLLQPVLRLLAPIPTIGLVPLAILWFGLGEESKALVVALGVFVPVWINSHAGLSTTPSDYLQAARCLGAGRWQTLREIVLPEAAPDIVAGLRVGAAMAFVLIVVAEMSGTTAGIGYRLYQAQLFSQADRLIACLILLGVIGALVDWVLAAVTAPLTRWAVKEH